MPPINFRNIDFEIAQKEKHYKWKGDFNYENQNRFCNQFKQ